MRIDIGKGLVRVVRDTSGLTDQVEDADVTLSEEQKSAARRIVCGNARGDTLAEQVADAELLMTALGIHPTQDTVEYLLGTYPPSMVGEGL